MSVVQPISDAPSFSIAIPTYNRASCIERTLQSVLSQTYTRYEIIVVDNCSSDGTEEILRAHIRSGKIRFIKHDKNYGRAYSRNTGLQQATGDYLTFLDSDDLMHPTNLEDAANYAMAHPQIKCFHNLYVLADEHCRILYRYRFPSLRNRIKAIVEGNFMSCIGVFVHREIYQRYRFDTHHAVSGSEDWEFWLRVLADYQVGRITKINSTIINHNGRSCNHRQLDEVHSGMRYIMSKITHDPHLRSVYQNYMRRMQASRLVFIAGVANANHQYVDALKLLHQAAAADPLFVASVRFLRTLQIALFRLDRSFAGLARDPKAVHQPYIT